MERKGLKQSGFQEVAVPWNNKEKIKDKNIHTSYSDIVPNKGFSGKKTKGDLPIID